ncbi:hypothetical protein E3U43_013705 [Larimichthys crocea]|uniref:Uncharacterized protein n=1 Tax=Larimichthys crocea TaxID=215358 RepID=A0ACD3RAP1_LARCR|nr:hypothetical protein E3U43_013705 [Larimichthys crocea]
MDQLLGDGSLAESTPLRDRMALYQAAISKQEVPPTSVSSDQLDGFCGKQKENVPPFSLDMSPESEPNGRKSFTPETNGSSPGTPASVQSERLFSAQVFQKLPPTCEGDLRVVSEDGVSSGEAGGQSARLPQLLFPLLALQHQTQFGELRLPPQQRLLQAALLPALQGQRKLRRGLRPPAPQRAVGEQRGEL